MKNIAKRSNRTRDEQRPPRLTPAVDSAILASLGFVKPRPAPKSADPKNSSRKKRGNAQPAPGGQPLTDDQSPSVMHQEPVTRDPGPSAEKRRPWAETQRAEAKEEPTQEDRPAVNSPQVQKGDPQQPEAGSPGFDRRSPARFQSTMNFQDKKNQGESSLPGSRMPGTNGNGMNGNGATANGKDGKTSALNGGNGYPPRSSLFRSGAFTNLPSVRIPPKAGGPAQRPPVQIPLETSGPSDKERQSPSRDEREIPPGDERERPLHDAHEGLPRVEQDRRSEIPAVTQPPTNPTPADPQKSSGVNPTGLEQLLKRSDLPDQAVLFGVCEDGLPMLLDLDDPTPGAVVVIGDQREAQLNILRTAVTSLAGRNSPRNVQFLVFSCEPDIWQRWVEEKNFTRHCLAIERAEPETVRDWIVRLADWTEQRRLGQISGPAVLLVMDTLSFLPQLEYDIRLNFDWMIKEGPPAHIWSVAVISTDLAKAISGRRMLRSFQTRMIGYANNPADLVQLAGVDEQDASTFNRRNEFAVKVGDNWLRFYLP